MKSLLFAFALLSGCTALVDFNKFTFGDASSGGSNDLAGVDLAGYDFSNGPDMAMATCGRLGLPCCSPSPACRDGSCCVGGNCSVPSGAPIPATSGMICQGGAQVICGDLNQPCCPENGCPTGGCCYGGYCRVTAVACGGGACVQMTTVSATCGTCGGDGQTCCDGTMDTSGKPSNFCVANGDVCNTTGMCTACGGSNQPCCAGNLCTAGCCDHSGGNNLGMCVSHCGGTNACVNSACTCTMGTPNCSKGTCGGLGQECCSAALCVAPFTVCLAGQCAPCGGNGQPCCLSADPQKGYCTSPYLCEDSGTCRKCGGKGDPCCAGGACNPGVGTCNGNTCPN
jgi:hypothetical protein